MIVKIHFVGDGRKVIAICDKKILGKKFTEGRRQLDLSSGFYKGSEKSEKEILALIKENDILNLVGEEAIRFAVKKNFISKGNIVKIKSIPHAQAVL